MGMKGGNGSVRIHCMRTLRAVVQLDHSKFSSYWPMIFRNATVYIYVSAL